MRTQNLFFAPIKEFVPPSLMLPSFDHSQNIPDNIERVTGGDGFIKLVAHLQEKQIEVADYLQNSPLDSLAMQEFEYNNLLIGLLLALREQDKLFRKKKALNFRT